MRLTPTATSSMKISTASRLGACPFVIAWTSHPEPSDFDVAGHSSPPLTSLAAIRSGSDKYQARGSRGASPASRFGVVAATSFAQSVAKTIVGQTVRFVGLGEDERLLREFTNILDRAAEQMMTLPQYTRCISRVRSS